jgi:hypothetical protein
MHLSFERKLANPTLFVMFLIKKKPIKQRHWELINQKLLTIQHQNQNKNKNVCCFKFNCLDLLT